MPRKVEWIHRIPLALDELEATSLPFYDRAALARLLGVSARQANRILNRLGASMRAGTAAVMARDELRSRLEALLSDDRTVWERKRLRRLDETLAQGRRDLAARQVVIAAPPETTPPRISGLPPTVCLTPGRLGIQFTDVEDLLRQLYLLGQAIAEDYAAFCTLVSMKSNRLPPS